MSLASAADPRTLTTAPYTTHTVCEADALHAGAVSTRARAWGRFRDYVQLTKPRIAMLSLLTVAVGYLLGSSGAAGWGLFHTLIGAAFLAAGAGALNQYLEYPFDACMSRTAQRPLPAGRLTPGAALCFGSVLAAVGMGYLWVASGPLAGLVGAATLVSYLFAYTPLKRRTTLNTMVGAVSGALPPVLGWAAARGEVGLPAWGLFLIVYLWQFPHFLAIAWIYRQDYERAGMKMLPVLDPTGQATGRQVLAYCLVLLPVSLGPSVLGLAGPGYFLGALAMSAWLLSFAVRFRLGAQHARSLLRASLVYLPALMVMLLTDPAWNRTPLLKEAIAMEQAMPHPQRNFQPVQNYRIEPKTSEATDSRLVNALN